MHRMPFWMAVTLEIALIIVAVGGNTAEYQINQEKLWLGIGVNFIFIAISLGNWIYSYVKNQKYNIPYESKIATKTQENYEDIFNLGLILIKTAKSKEEIDKGVLSIIYVAKNGYQPAIKLLEEIKAKNIKNDVN